MKTPKPIPQELLDALVYDETSPTCLRFREWSKGRRTNLQAGFIKKDTGYGMLSWGPRGSQLRFLAHRVVWAMHHGDAVDMVVDHIDCNPSNNKLDNLQAITFAENRSRQTGHGAYRSKDGRWYSQLSIRGKFHYLGRFDTEDEARAAYVKAKREATKGLQVDL